MSAGSFEKTMFWNNFFVALRTALAHYKGKALGNNTFAVHNPRKYYIYNTYSTPSKLLQPKMTCVLVLEGVKEKQ